MVYENGTTGIRRDTPSITAANVKASIMLISDGPAVNQRSRGLEKLRFPTKNVLHQFTGVHAADRQRPCECFGDGELARRAGALIVTPEANKLTNGAGTATKAPQLRSSFRRCIVGQRFGMVNEPLDEDAGLGVTKTSSESLVG